MSENRLAAIRARLDKATPGPWTWETDTVDSATVWTDPVTVVVSGVELVSPVPENPRLIASLEGHPNVWDDASLIAHAPADLAWLLERVESLEKDLQDLVDDFAVVSPEEEREVERLTAEVERLQAESRRRAILLAWERLRWDHVARALGLEWPAEESPDETGETGEAMTRAKREAVEAGLAVIERMKGAGEDDESND